MSTFAIRSRRVLTPAGIRPATVTVRDEVIASVGSEVPAGLQLVDIGDDLLAPALVDTHVHVNEPGRTAWEGFATATRAALAGGVTVIVDMPLNSIPVTTTVAALQAKLEAAQGQIHVDCGFWGGVVPGNTGEIVEMVERGVLGFKAFLCHSGIEDFPAVTEADLRIAMPILREAGVPLLVHAELESHLSEPDEFANPRAYRNYLQSRPASAEDAAVALMMRLCEETGCAVHIVHLSSATALAHIAEAKRRGLPVTVETCPHYLCLLAEDVPDGATEYKCAPPIRGSENREALWKGLADGTIDCVLTDHSPCIPVLKKRTEGNFYEAWGGIASLQLALPNVWTEAKRRGFGHADLNRWMSQAPAKLLGSGLPRGEIAPGHIADLVAWQPEQSFRIDAERLYFRNKLTPYLGKRVTGEVRSTWLRGRVRLFDGRWVDDEPLGRLLLGRSE